jgi:organic hydroperoxide reductase OsmC/OhrA
MSVFHATVDWRLEGDFLARRYSRAHTLTFEHGLVVPGSPAISVVPLPYSREGALDPEAAFTGSISACHMLWFLDVACQAGFTVASYCDEAEGVLAKNAQGKLAMTRVVLRPRIEFAGDKRPSSQELKHLHHRAHEECFIANSVKTEVVIEG